ncbi:LysR family transcriptional regulator [Aurantimonas sp. VKM B-3413]|uniref:LysR family transcriptional regulator n=1 Tax=Aurantimonas sp. VKM B-3413 TaxID=2779401 RepID=UPI001E579A55|nr:LysR family transcriptional regulator [Aurantimonas sp. VKM B-3413]MCB8836109.1 LysR family transcriptional regulator [Aurantimonas sp. VKM B-3413]
MNLKGLEALRAFMEGGSVNAAAERLRRTQPQVSRLLAALEDEIRFPLFTRKNRRLVPTQQAREFYAHVEHALYTLDEAMYAAERVRDRQRRHVRILTAPHVTDALLADAIAVMTQEDSGFTASIDSRSRLDIEIWLGREQFDLGITVLPLDSDVIDVEPMVAVRAVAVMRHDHPLAQKDRVHVSDLVDMPLVANAPRTVVRQHIDAAFRKIGRQPTIRLETPNGQVACELAGRGLGVAIADGFVARSSLKPAMVIRPFEPPIELRYVFIFPKWQPRTPSVNRLASLIREAARRQGGADVSAEDT